jgi:hypothetical protein
MAIEVWWYLGEKPKALDVRKVEDENWCRVEYKNIILNKIWWHMESLNLY